MLLLWNICIYVSVFNKGRKRLTKCHYPHSVIYLWSTLTDNPHHHLPFYLGVKLKHGYGDWWFPLLVSMVQCETGMLLYTHNSCCALLQWANPMAFNAKWGKSHWLKESHLCAFTVLFLTLLWECQMIGQRFSTVVQGTLKCYLLHDMWKDAD